MSQTSINEQISPRQACLDLASDDDANLAFLDGHDDAILGVVEHNGFCAVVYDVKKIVRKLRRRDGMSTDEALEFFAYNIAGAQLGEGTPLFLASIKK